MIPILATILCAALASAESSPATGYVSSSSGSPSSISRDFDYATYAKSKLGYSSQQQQQQQQQLQQQQQSQQQSQQQQAQPTYLTTAASKSESRFSSEPIVSADSQSQLQPQSGPSQSSLNGNNNYYKTKYGGDATANALQAFQAAELSGQSPGSGNPFGDYSTGSGKPGSQSPPIYGDSHQGQLIHEYSHGPPSSSSGPSYHQSYPGGPPSFGDYPGSRPPMFIHSNSPPPSMFFGGGGPSLGHGLGHHSFSHGDRIILPANFKPYPMSSFSSLSSKYPTFNFIPKTRTYSMPSSFLGDASPSASHIPSYASSSSSGPSSFFSSMTRGGPGGSSGLTASASSSIGSSASSGGPYYFSSSPIGSYSKSFGSPMRISSSGYGSAPGSPGKILVVRDSSGHLGYPSMMGSHSGYRSRISPGGGGSSAGGGFMSAATSFLGKGLASSLFGDS